MFIIAYGLVGRFSLVLQGRPCLSAEVLLRRVVSSLLSESDDPNYYGATPDSGLGSPRAGPGDGNRVNE